MQDFTLFFLKNKIFEPPHLINIIQVWMLSPAVTIRKNKKLVIVPVHILSGNRRAGNSNGSLSLLLLHGLLPLRCGFI